MTHRIDYSTINPHAIKTIRSVNKHLHSITNMLRALIELRVSQINGCAYCLDLHSKQARDAGETQQRLDCLPAWKESSLFTDQECAALDWAEAVTNIGKTHIPEEKYEELKLHFSNQQIVDLTLIISLMNSWNRIGVSFRKIPTPES